jgi:hypothetical protein
MSKIFDIVNGKVVINAQSLAIPSLKKIWDRDKSKEKDTATKEITYVVFLCDYNSPYKEYSLLDKADRLKEEIIGNKNWEPDLLINDAIKQYEELQQTTNTRLIRSSKVAAEKLAKYFENIDFENAEDPDKLATATTANIERVSRIIKSLSAMEKQLKVEQTESSSIRGGKEVGDYELPQNSNRRE